MKIKRYTANTEYDAIEKAREELGEDTYILHSKKVKQKGLFSIFKKRKIEIVVGVDEKSKEEQEKQEEIENLKSNIDSQSKELGDIKNQLTEMTNLFKKELDKQKEDVEFARKIREKQEREEFFKKIPKEEKEIKVEKENPLDTINKIYDAENKEKEYTELILDTKFEEEKKPKEEIRKAEEKLASDRIREISEEIKKAEERISRDNQGPKEENSIKQNLEPSNIDEEKEEKGKFEENKFYKRLIAHGVHKDLVNKIFDIAKRRIDIKNAGDEICYKTLLIIIKDFLGMPFRLEHMTGKKRVIFFAGPTGVGKTTTIAKIAAKLSIGEGKRVALITADTYRMAAVEQLRAYGKILSTPISVVYKPSEISEVIDTYSSYDYILIDTAGRNHRDRGIKDYLNSFIKEAGRAETFLLINLSTSQKDIENILISYEFLSDYKVIYTKLDETVSKGNILNIRAATDKAGAFITNGQSVPDDIFPAEPENIAAMLLGERVWRIRQKSYVRW